MTAPTGRSDGEPPAEGEGGRYPRPTVAEWLAGAVERRRDSLREDDIDEVRARITALGGDGAR